MAVLEVILYAKIKGGDKYEMLHEIHWWQSKETGESIVGKSLGLAKNQNGKTHTFYIGRCKLVNNEHSTL